MCTFKKLNFLRNSDILVIISSYFNFLYGLKPYIITIFYSSTTVIKEGETEGVDNILKILLQNFATLQKPLAYSNKKCNVLQIK